MIGAYCLVLSAGLWLRFAVFGVAILAINWPSLSWLEWYGGFDTASRTGCREGWTGASLSAAASFSPAIGPAFGTALGFIHQSVRLKKFLLADSESELTPTIVANQCLVFQSHDYTPPIVLIPSVQSKLVTFLLTWRPDWFPPIDERTELWNSTEQRFVLIIFL